MSHSDTTEAEHENLAIHVEKCELRYQSINARLDKIETGLDQLFKEITKGNSSMTKVLIGTAGTVIAGLLSTIVIILINGG